MSCFHPLTGYYAREVNETGKRSIVFSSDKALVDVPVNVPCGRCIGCRLDRSRDWALRCVHEASLYESNCFITLTFDDKFLGDGSLKVSDFQNFMKRLRQAISPQRVRFFHCGEYGEKFSRPHHHACLFGFDFPDKVLFKTSSQGNIYTSEMLQKLWPFGFSTVGAVTFESAAYVARYVMKKWSKEYDEYVEHGLDKEARQELYDTMVIMSDEAKRAMYYGGRHEEYVTMSRRPGIGSAWYDKFSSDIYPSGFDILKGKKVPLPTFFDSRFELDNFMGYAKLKARRLMLAEEDICNNSKKRLLVREQVKLLNSKKLIRGYENVD